MALIYGSRVGEALAVEPTIKPAAPGSKIAAPTDDELDLLEFLGSVDADNDDKDWLEFLKNTDIGKVAKAKPPATPPGGKDK